MLKIIRSHDQSETLLVYINPFSTNVPLLTPLKTSENFSFSDVFRGYRSGTFFENGLKAFLDNKKIPCILPLLHGKFITNFKEKAEIFNNFFLKSNVLL